MRNLELIREIYKICRAEGKLLERGDIPGGYIREDTAVKIEMIIEAHRPDLRNEYEVR